MATRSDMQPGTEDFTERSSIWSAFSTDLSPSPGGNNPLYKVAASMESIPKRYIVPFMAFLGFCKYTVMDVKYLKLVFGYKTTTVSMNVLFQMGSPTGLLLFKIDVLEACNSGAGNGLFPQSDSVSDVAKKLVLLLSTGGRSVSLQNGYRTHSKFSDSDVAIAFPLWKQSCRSVLLFTTIPSNARNITKLW